MLGAEQRRLVAGDVRLRGQRVHRLRAADARDRLHRERRDPASASAARRLGRRQRRQEADEDRPSPSLRDLLARRRRDLDDDVGAPRVADRRAGLLNSASGISAASPAPASTTTSMSLRRGSFDDLGHERDAALAVGGLLGDADPHAGGNLSRTAAPSARPARGGRRALPRAARAPGAACRPAPVSACAVTQTGVWRARARVADAAVGGDERAQVGERRARPPRRTRPGSRPAATSAWTPHAVDCAFDAAARLQREAAVGVLLRAMHAAARAHRAAAAAAPAATSAWSAPAVSSMPLGAPRRGEVPAAVAVLLAREPARRAADGAVARRRPAARSARIAKAGAVDEAARTSRRAGAGAQRGDEVDAAGAARRCRRAATSARIVRSTSPGRRAARARSRREEARRSPARRRGGPRRRGPSPPRRCRAPPSAPPAARAEAAVGVCARGEVGGAAASPASAARAGAAGSRDASAASTTAAVAAAAAGSDGASGPRSASRKRCSARTSAGPKARQKTTFPTAWATLNGSDVRADRRGTAPSVCCAAERHPASRSP